MAEEMVHHWFKKRAALNGEKDQKFSCQQGSITE